MNLFQEMRTSLAQIAFNAARADDNGLRVCLVDLTTQMATLVNVAESLSVVATGQQRTIEGIMEMIGQAISSGRAAA